MCGSCRRPERMRQQFERDGPANDSTARRRLHHTGWQGRPPERGSAENSQDLGSKDEPDTQCPVPRGRPVGCGARARCRLHLPAEGLEGPERCERQWQGQEVGQDRMGCRKPSAGQDPGDGRPRFRHVAPTARHGQSAAGPGTLFHHLQYWRGTDRRALWRGLGRRGQDPVCRPALRRSLCRKSGQLSSLQRIRGCKAQGCRKAAVQQATAKAAVQRTTAFGTNRDLRVRKSKRRSSAASRCWFCRAK